jgi:hypothetical protein
VTRLHSVCKYYRVQWLVVIISASIISTIFPDVDNCWVTAVQVSESEVLVWEFQSCCPSSVSWYNKEVFSYCLKKLKQKWGVRLELLSRGLMSQVRYTDTQTCIAINISKFPRNKPFQMQLWYDDVCWRVLTCADVSGRMLTCADVCWRMLKYADVCRRMLTYADVCWLFPSCPDDSGFLKRFFLLQTNPSAGWGPFTSVTGWGPCTSVTSFPAWVVLTTGLG